MKILIIKTSAIGDILQAFFVLEPIKKQFPNAQIDWVVEAPFRDIVDAHPLIDQTIAIESKKWRKFKSLDSLKETIKKIRSTRYDYVIDLQGNIKSGLVSLFAKGLKGGYGRKTAPEKVNVFFTKKHIDPKPNQNQRQDYLDIVKGTIGFEGELKPKRLPIKPIKKIMVCPGSAWPNKQLTDETLIAFLQKVANPDRTFYLVWGSQKEKETCEKVKSALANVEVVDRRPIPQLAELMRTMDLVIAMDSMALHLAADLNVATFSLFGPSLGERYKPLNNLAIVYQGPCPYSRTFDRRCPLMRTCETGACLREADPKILADAFTKAFS